MLIMNYCIRVFYRNRTNYIYIYIYSWSLNNGFEQSISTYMCIFFYKYTLSPPYLWVSHPQIQPNSDQISICDLLNLWMWNPQIRMADCTSPFYIRDLSIHRFGIHLGSWNQPPWTPRDRLFVYIWYQYKNIVVRLETKVRQVNILDDILSKQNTSAGELAC